MRFPAFSTSPRIGLINPAFAKRIKNAVEKVVNEGKYVTPDLNPHSKAGTIEMGNAIVGAME
jgi:isocitrate/isopropylmalate dehydrogenase